MSNPDMPTETEKFRLSQRCMELHGQLEWTLIGHINYDDLVELEKALSIITANAQKNEEAEEDADREEDRVEDHGADSSASGEG